MKCHISFINSIKHILLEHVKIYAMQLFLIDIDECADGIDVCQQECENSVGGYNCECLPGYVLEDDRITCVDGKHAFSPNALHWIRMSKPICNCIYLCITVCVF